MSMINFQTSFCARIIYFTVLLMSAISFKKPESLTLPSEWNISTISQLRHTIGGKCDIARNRMMILLLYIFMGFCGIYLRDVSIYIYIYCVLIFLNIYLV